MKMETILTKSIVYRSSMNLFSYFSPITLLLLGLITYFVILYNKKRARLVKFVDKLPGPAALPLIGNTIEVNVDHDDILNRFIVLTKCWGRRGLTRAWNGLRPMVFIDKASAAEPILSSNKHIDKSPEYDYLHSWLGTGLLTSSGKKWHSRRKILTPSFHFKILDDFIEIFHEQASVMVKKLQKEVDNPGFNLFPYVTLCTLDIICETAMGIRVNAQECSDSDYVKAVYQIGSIVLNRQSKIWLQPEYLFKLTTEYNRHKRCIEILHGVSNKVIKERKEEILRKKNNNNNNNINENNNNILTINKQCTMEEEIGEKKRLAFLDLLIEASKDGTVLSNEDIREEVDTFMFEGHDTTSAAISWTVFLVGSNKNIQDRVYEELYTIFGDDTDRPATMKELNDMKYLECCIKEALRLFPSVPMMARHLNEDVQIGEYMIPRGSTALICTYMLHRDPQVYKNPEAFDPERFTPENTKGRHPYSYIPFSAGPRNCIGQKFAILEEKIILSSIFRKYIVETCDRREDLTILCEQILRPKHGLRVKITSRN
ncbi:cytochrome P450 4c3 [Culicoides brevitarsis]|uniref:cytochrome P450 4c3 n=1 Tax=Culicoides brevitarsis TaxID=469753 RepID=UPI00307B91BB